MKLFKTIQKQETTIGHKNKNQVTATGGYKKLGQLLLNGATHVVLGVRDAGVMTDTLVGEVNTVKSVLVEHEAKKIDSYRSDLKSLNKQLSKAKKKSIRKELKSDIAIVKQAVSYYEKKLASARKL